MGPPLCILWYVTVWIRQYFFICSISYLLWFHPSLNLKSLHCNGIIWYLCLLIYFTLILCILLYITSQIRSSSFRYHSLLNQKFDTLTLFCDIWLYLSQTNHFDKISYYFILSLVIRLKRWYTTIQNVLKFLRYVTLCIITTVHNW